MLKCAADPAIAVNGKLAEPTAPRVNSPVRPLLLFGGQLLRRNVASGAFLVGILDSGPKRTGLILLARGRIEVGKVKLRHRGRHCLRRLRNDRVVEVDGLGIARRLMIKTSQGQFGQVGRPGPTPAAAFS